MVTKRDYTELLNDLANERTRCRAITEERDLLQRQVDAYPLMQTDNQRLMRAVELIGECLRDFGRVLCQGIREDNMMLRGNVAAGFERAASYIRNEDFHGEIDPKHINIDRKPARTMEA